MVFVRETVTTGVFLKQFPLSYTRYSGLKKRIGYKARFIASVVGTVILVESIRARPSDNGAVEDKLVCCVFVIKKTPTTIA